ncbi:hypothetical protein ACM39_01710 [Chryseobacterium sp. FH2]|uniref:hypothetical protein n=1 Tax=Chryseobacterium sp. FH2 TaxID=1674291 RepID=UPI00065AC152|nr:hypothetical protein [Chryseobacterium sp. FH2]KMQ69790.1 hypothetical protein ACM39_01710 [Chryseobacterium sp. FH2]
MSKNILFALLFFNIISCQKKDSNIQTSSLNTNHENKMKQNTSGPFYALSLDASGDFQVYINDILVAYYYQTGATNLTIPINREILGSGKQSIKIALKSDKELDDTELKYYKFRVLKYASMDSPDYETIVDCKFDTEKSKKVKEFTQIWDFTSTVPYKVVGWSQSETLLNEDKDVLLKEVLAVYNNFRDILQKKDVSSFLAKTKTRDTEIDKALYFSDSDIQQDKSETTATIQNITEVLPLENYKLAFYGQGRMVALIRTDSKSKDESPLQAKLKDNSTEIYDLVLHRPKKGAPLEVIR